MAVTVPVRKLGTGGSETCDQLLDALVTGLEGILAEHGALGLVVELQVHPVDRVVALALLGPADELAAEAGARRLGRFDDGAVDALVGDDALDEGAIMHAVVEAAPAAAVAVRQGHRGDARVG